MVVGNTNSLSVKSQILRALATQTVIAVGLQNSLSVKSQMVWPLAPTKNGSRGYKSPLWKISDIVGFVHNKQWQLG